MQTAIASMRAKQKARANGEDAGFTLVEALITVGIIAVLLAIAVPLYLGLTGSSKSKDAQVALTSLATTVKGLAADAGGANLDAATVAALTTAEPAYAITAGAATSTLTVGAGKNASNQRKVEVNYAAGKTVMSLTAMGDNGTCYRLVVSMTGADTRSKGAPNTACTATNVDTALANAGW